MTTALAFPDVILVQKGVKNAQLALADSNGKLQKLHLRIRQHKLEVELEKISLPSTQKELLEFGLKQRQEILECRYNLACFWVKLKAEGERFWTQFGYQRPDELLVSLDLPMGETLSNWEIIVRLFDRQTFMLAGDGILAYMVTLFVRCQPDAQKRLKDFQAIFDDYCAKHHAFDKAAFRAVVNEYANRHYFKDQKPAQEDLVKRPPVSAGPGRTIKLRPVFRGFLPEDGNIPPEPRIYERSCAGCKDRDEKLEAAMRQIERLEAFIEENLGKEFVPQRPKILEMVVQ